MALNYQVTYQATVGVTTVSTQILALNNFRTYLFIQNQGTDTIWIQFKKAQTGNTGKLILSGSSYEPVLVPVDRIFLIANSGTQNVFICEGSEVGSI